MLNNLMIIIINQLDIVRHHFLWHLVNLLDILTLLELQVIFSHMSQVKTVKNIILVLNDHIGWVKAYLPGMVNFLRQTT